MISETLNAIARRSLEVMVGKGLQSVNTRLILDTYNNSLNLNIDKTPFSDKMKNIGAQLTKQNIAHLMDAPMNFHVTSNVNPESSEFDELWDNGGDIKVTIEPAGEYANEFLTAYSKEKPTVSFSTKEIPKFENAQI